MKNKTATCIDCGSRCRLRRCWPCNVKWRKNGDTRGTIEQRFWSKVVKSHGDRCWEWTGGTGSHGYGSFRPTKPVGVTAHRFAWELTNGPVPDGLHVLHHCDNRLCVKTAPDKLWPNGHLFLGTQADNMADMVAKDRPRGRYARRVAA